MKCVKKHQVQIWRQTKVHVTIHSVIRRGRRRIRDIKKRIVYTFYCDLVGIFIQILQLGFGLGLFIVICGCESSSFFGQIVVFNVRTPVCVWIGEAEYVSESCVLHVLRGRTCIRFRVQAERGRAGGVAVPAVFCLSEWRRAVFDRIWDGFVSLCGLLLGGDRSVVIKPLLQLQLHVCVDVVAPYVAGVELNAACGISTAFLRASTGKVGTIHLALDASLTAGTGLGLTEALAVASAVFPPAPQIL